MKAKNPPVPMRYYHDHIVPHLVNLAMRNRLLKAYRQRIVPLAEGRVLEIGFGSGMNLPFYTDRASVILGLEPHPRLLEMASQKSHRGRAKLIEGSAESIPLVGASNRCRGDDMDTAQMQIWSKAPDFG